MTFKSGASPANHRIAGPDQSRLLGVSLGAVAVLAGGIGLGAGWFGGQPQAATQTDVIAEARLITSN